MKDEINRGEYQCEAHLDLYDSPSCQSLATQAATGRHLQVLSTLNKDAIEVRLCEDGYSAWLPMPDLDKLTLAQTTYQAIALTRTEIHPRLPDVIAFTQNASKVPNYYLWGGTVSPNYDCSGLMQAAFAASGIWLPRDSYQQADFTESISVEELQPGDLVFFASDQKVNHVGLYLGNHCYIHSSGKDKGRNGIAIDRLSTQGDAIARAYYQQLHSCGRVVANYQLNQ
ncbi:MAG: C40 family peptidase [Kastovskya adunca ATA6-11-RM4]|jgi:cell wall-associated NlpC family hydrolase|nr:C40 family peptidase [Kastovskya adunca ATA6-11-RM4]